MTNHSTQDPMHISYRRRNVSRALSLVTTRDQVEDSIIPVQGQRSKRRRKAKRDIHQGTKTIGDNNRARSRWWRPTMTLAPIQTCHLPLATHLVRQLLVEWNQNGCPNGLCLLDQKSVPLSASAVVAILQATLLRRIAERLPAPRSRSAPLDRQHDRLHHRQRKVVTAHGLVTGTTGITEGVAMDEIRQDVRTRHHPTMCGVNPLRCKNRHLHPPHGHQHHCHGRMLICQKLTVPEHPVPHLEVRPSVTGPGVQVHPTTDGTQQEAEVQWAPAAGRSIPVEGRTAPLGREESQLHHHEHTAAVPTMRVAVTGAPTPLALPAVLLVTPPVPMLVEVSACQISSTQPAWLQSSANTNVLEKSNQNGLVWTQQTQPRERRHRLARTHGHCPIHLSERLSKWTRTMKHLHPAHPRNPRSLNALWGRLMRTL